MCIVGNPIILHCQIISFPPKKEKENGIMEFLNLFICIYIYSKNPLWLRIISQIKQRFSKVVKLYLLPSKKKKGCEIGPYGQTRLTGNRSPKRFF